MSKRTIKILVIKGTDQFVDIAKLNDGVYCSPKPYILDDDHDMASLRSLLIKLYAYRNGCDIDKITKTLDNNLELCEVRTAVMTW